MAAMEVHDRLARPMRDLRVSVTDRCNFRCGYCMPMEVFGPGFRFLPRAEILTFEEIAEVVRVAADLGVTKVRLTGGEPLLRRDLPALVELLAGIPGITDLAMTTNGALLARYAGDLAKAGLDRVTVSLDSVDPGVFRTMNGVGVELETVLHGLEVAAAAEYDSAYTFIFSPRPGTRAGAMTDEFVPEQFVRMARWANRHR